MTTPAPELRALSPLEILDGALVAVRRGGAAQLLRALCGSAPLAIAALAVYYFERVEGVRSLRPAFAVLLVLGFWLRAFQLSRTARSYALAIRPTLPVVDTPPRAVEVCCTASVVGFGLWLWLWPLAAMALLSPWAVAGVLPLLGARGAIAPSWLARASCARERGFSAFGQAFDDTSGMRGAFLIVELMALFGMIGLFANLYALTGFALLLGHALLGIDVAFVSSFLSLENRWVLLLLSVVSLLLFEPLRAAISAQAFVDARSRRDGADLHAAVDAAIAQSGERPRRARDSLPPGAAAIVFVAFALGLAPAGRAQQDDSTATVDAPDEPSSRLDAQAREQLGEILSRPEFREFAERDTQGLGEWLEKLLKWLDLDLSDDDSHEPRSQAIRLPALSPWLIMALAIVALSLIAVYATSRSRASPQRPRSQAAAGEIAADARPLSLLEEAQKLAERGDLRGALRALYLSTLVTLDRKQLIEYEPWKTNGQYIRSMQRGELRKLFAAFTRIFDHKWYGHEPATVADYAECRKLAERIGETAAA